MVTRKGGARRKTKHQMTKGYREKSKPQLKKYFQKFKKGDKVIIKPDSSYQKGLCHRRYFNKTAVIEKPKGKCYEIILLVNKKPKTLIIHPIHLSKK